MTETLNKSAAGTERQPAEESWVILAQIVRPQGRKGELLAELLTDFPERFAERRRLFLRSNERAVPREVTLEEHWVHKGRLVLKLKGVDSIEDAELLRGHEVVIPWAERAPLDEDSVYIADLAGCVLYDRASSSVVGTILDVDRESSNMPLIVVRASGARGELLIPFAKAYLPQIDLVERRMEMTLPDGLLALNDPLTAEERQALAAAQAADGAQSMGRSSSEKKRR